MLFSLKRSFVVTVQFALLVLLLPISANASNTAVLSKLSGNVEVWKGGMKERQAARLDMLLEVGDKVVTKGKASSADITFPNGDVVRVMSDSKLVIKVADFKKKSFFIRMKLLSGKIFNVVNKVGDGSKYEVETHVAVAGVRGTVWSAETTEGDDGEDVIMVKEGRVATMNAQAGQGSEVVVGSLRKTRVRMGNAPTTPQPMTPEEIAMFDVLDDLFEEIKEDIKDEIMEGVAEDIMEQSQGQGAFP